MRILLRRYLAVGRALAACTMLAAAAAALPAQQAGGLSLAARDSLRAAIEQSVATATWPPLERATARLRAAASSAAGQTDAWLHYDLAYALHRRASVMLVQGNTDGARALLEEAVREAARAGELGAGAEATALEGAVTGQLAGARGGLSAMRLGPRSFRLLDQAIEAAPTNPRAALLNGISRLNAPRLFGGGAEKAEPELRRALRLYASDSSRAPQPVWGLVDAHLWLGVVLRDLGRPEEARAEWRRALELAPGHRWIVEELLPSLPAAGYHSGTLSGGGTDGRLGRQVHPESGEEDAEAGQAAEHRAQDLRQDGAAARHGRSGP